MSDPLHAQAGNLAALVQYQPDAIVSRTLINRPGGNVTLFAFSQGQSLTEHTSPFDALVQILDGNAEVSIAQQTFALNQGEAIILPANQPHAVNAIADFKMLLTMIRS